jgi:hypothetical protein
MPASPTLDKAPGHTDACEHTVWCVDSGSERLAVWLPGTRALHHPGCSGDASLGRALLLLCLLARMAGQEVCNMCFLRECNVCASVRIFLQRNSFDQSHTERRAPQGGVRRCSVSTRCRTGTPGRWAGTRRGDAGADVHTSSTQTPRKRAVFLGRGACHTPERCCCTWRGQRASARGGQAPWDPFAQCGGRSYRLRSGVCPRLCRAHLSQTPGRIEAYACIHTSTSANAKC